MVDRKGFQTLRGRFPARMKADICSGYEPPEFLQLREIEKPAPTENEVLIQARPTTVTKSTVDSGGAPPPPANATFEESAAVLQDALTALYFIRRGDIQREPQVLVFGASGGVGSYSVQLAKQFGAEVTGVCSTGRVEYVKSLGADRVIDYNRENFNRNRRTYDVIFDTGARVPYRIAGGRSRKTGPIFSPPSVVITVEQGGRI